MKHSFARTGSAPKPPSGPRRLLATMLLAGAASMTACDRPSDQSVGGGASSSSSTVPVTAPPSGTVAGPARASAPATVRTFELGPDAREASSADGTYRVRWEPEGGAIPDAEPFAIRLEVVRADGKPLAGDARILVDAEMPHHGHGMNLVPVVSRAAPGKFVASGMLMHMPGRWVVAIDVEEDGLAERAQWYVEIE